MLDLAVTGEELTLKMWAKRGGVRLKGWKEVIGGLVDGF